MEWTHYAYGCRTEVLIDEILNICLDNDIKIYGVIGPSRSGKDTFCGVSGFRNYRFGDTMKRIAHELGIVPEGIKYYEDNPDARFEVLPNGKTVLEGWISLDPLREYNPLIFIEPKLHELKEDLENNNLVTNGVIFSGMRTETGLGIVENLCSNSGGKMIKIIREGHEPPKEATMDDVQNNWKYDDLYMNSAGSAKEWKIQSGNIWRTL